MNDNKFQIKLGIFFGVGGLIVSILLKEVGGLSFALSMLGFGYALGVETGGRKSR